MGDIAGLALSIVTLLDTCLTLTKLLSTAKSFSTEAETLRIGLLREEGRLKTWARSWGIPNDGNTYGKVVPEGEATKLLLEEAQNESFDLSAIQRTLDNMLELLSLGDTIQNRHGRRNPGTVSPLISLKPFNTKLTVSIGL
jgi:Prion-inhibition and propagation